MKNFKIPTLPTSFKVTMAVLLVLALAGFGSYGYQLINGLGTTGLNNGTSWGMYIAMFLFCEGMASGCMILATSGYVFKNDALKRCALPGAALGLIFMAFAGLFVTLDLGNIFHILNLIIHLNFVSPLAWDIMSITSFLVVAVAFIAMILMHKDDSKLHNALAHIAFALAIIVPTVAAFIFAVHAGREGWHSAVMPPLFVASGLDSGAALLILTLMGLTRQKVFEVADSLLDTLSGLLTMFVAADAFMIISELVIMSYPGVPGDLELLHEMTQGAVSGYFWVEIIVGLAIPFALLMFSSMRKRKPVVAIASLGVIIGVFCKRMWLTMTSFIHPNIAGAPGLITATENPGTGMDVWAVTSSYVPQMPEIILAIGMFALACALFLAFAYIVLPWFDQNADT